METNDKPSYRKYTVKQVNKIKSVLRICRKNGMKRSDMIEALNKAGLTTASGEEFNTVRLNNFISVHARRMMRTYTLKERPALKARAKTVVSDAVAFSRDVVNSIQNDSTMSEAKKAELLFHYLGE